MKFVLLLPLLLMSCTAPCQKQLYHLEANAFINGLQKNSTLTKYDATNRGTLEQ